MRTYLLAATLISLATTAAAQTSTTIYTHHTHTVQTNANGAGFTDGCPYPMETNDFNTAKTIVEKASIEDVKLAAAKAIIHAHCLSCDQIMIICRLLTYEESKLKFAKMAYARTTDPSSYAKVDAVFSSDASRADLDNFIRNAIVK